MLLFSILPYSHGPRTQKISELRLERKDLPVQMPLFWPENAPFIFDRLGKAVCYYLSLRGIRIIIYLDDILVLDSTFGKCLKDAQFVVDTLVKLGFLH